MKATDKADFCSALKLCYATLLKPLPGTDAMNLWFALLEPYSLEQVKTALGQHMAESSFAPVPADVIKRMPKESDGQPDANEAWAIALRSRDERETVVWTEEAAQAFSIAIPVLDGGDEVGARMAFKAAYDRLVEKGRNEGRKAQWIKSLGHDPARREQVLVDAVRAGRLQLTDVLAVVPALAAPEETIDPAIAAANLQRLRQLTAGIASAREQRAARQEAERQAAAEFLETRKREAAELVQSHEARA